jgi:hypothetical protein
MVTVGDRVRIENLQSPRGQRLNGSYGLVIASAGDRLRVMIDDFSTGMFRPDNLVISNLDGIDFRQLFENPSTVKDETIEEPRG